MLIVMSLFLGQRNWKVLFKLFQMTIVNLKDVKMAQLYKDTLILKEDIWPSTTYINSQYPCLLCLMNIQFRKDLAYIKNNNNMDNTRRWDDWRLISGTDLSIWLFSQNLCRNYSRKRKSYCWTLFSNEHPIMILLAW